MNSHHIKFNEKEQKYFLYNCFDSFEFSFYMIDYLDKDVSNLKIIRDNKEYFNYNIIIFELRNTNRFLVEIIFHSKELEVMYNLKN